MPPETGNFPIVVPGFTFAVSPALWLPFYFKDESRGLELCSDIPGKPGVRDPEITADLIKKAVELDRLLWSKWYTRAPRSSFYSPFFASQVEDCGVSYLD